MNAIQQAMLKAGVVTEKQIREIWKRDKERRLARSVVLAKPMARPEKKNEEIKPEKIKIKKRRKKSGRETKPDTENRTRVV